MTQTWLLVSATVATALFVVGFVSMAEDARKVNPNHTVTMMATAILYLIVLILVHWIGEVGALKWAS